MSSAEQPHEEHQDEIATNYVPPPPKSIGELVAADQEDESLRKYKETLLGNAVAENIVIGLKHIASIMYCNLLSFLTLLRTWESKKSSSEEVSSRF